MVIREEFNNMDLEPNVDIEKVKKTFRKSINAQIEIHTMEQERELKEGIKNANCKINLLKASHFVADILKDLEYLREMKRREETGKDRGLGIDIVPISGLIVGRFCRLRNELKTVIEIWETKGPSR